MYTKTIFVFSYLLLFQQIFSSISAKECTYKASLIKPSFSFKGLADDNGCSSITTSWSTNTVTITDHKNKNNEIIVHQSLLVDIKKEARMSDSKILRIFLAMSSTEQCYFDITRQRLDEICENRKTLTGKNFIQNCVIENVEESKDEQKSNALKKGRVEHEWFGASLGIEANPFTIKDQHNHEYRAHDLLNCFKDSITDALKEKKSIIITLRQVHHPDTPLIRILCVPEWVPKQTENPDQTKPDLAKQLASLTQQKDFKSMKNKIDPKKSFFESLYVWQKLMIGAIFFGAAIIFITYNLNKVKA